MNQIWKGVTCGKMKAQKIFDYLSLGKYIKSGTKLNNFELGPNGIFLRNNLIQNYKNSFKESSKTIFESGEASFEKSEKTWNILKHWTESKPNGQFSIVHVPNFEHFGRKFFDTSRYKYLTTFLPYEIKANWCLLNKNRLLSFVIGAKNKQHYNSSTFMRHRRTVWCLLNIRYCRKNNNNT